MKQPELGLKITALRKEKNLTQEDLVSLCNVSVRTLQRIENGEVMPRVSTLKIILAAMGEDFAAIKESEVLVSENKNLLKKFLMMSRHKNENEYEFKNALQIAAVAGIIFLVLEILLSALDAIWFSGTMDRVNNIFYVALTAFSLIAFLFFMRGFLVLSHLFGNTLLKAGSYMLMIGMTGLALLDVYCTYYLSKEEMLIPYGVAAVIMGAMSIVFGSGLIKLQDGMGELARITGILEIVMGCLLVTVILFFFSFIVMIPATILEIVLLFKGYEYLERTSTSMPAS